MKTRWVKPLNTHDRSFTLVEMLVVISIIAILAALLLPEIGMVKDRSKTVVCAHNEKRIGEAFSSYLNDNQGFYPYAYPDCGATSNCACTVMCSTGSSSCAVGSAWNVRLTPYYGYSINSFNARIQNNMCQICGNCGPLDGQTWQEQIAYAQFMQCQSNPWQIPLGLPAECGQPVSQTWVKGGFPQQSNPGSGWSLFATTYAMNVDGFPTTWGTKQGSACASPIGFFKCMNMADINHPSSLALIGEMPWMQYKTPSPSLPSNWGLTQGLPGLYGLMSASRVGGANPAAGYIWTNITKFAYCNGYMAAWHRNSMNTLFTDGHVEQISYSTLTNYSDQWMNTNTTSAGGIFFNDGKPLNWYANQFPGYNMPLSFY